MMSEMKQRIAKESYQDSLNDIDDSINITTFGKGAFHLKFGMSSTMQTAQWLCRLEPYSSLNFYSSDYKRDPRVPIDF